ncbi:MAG: DUF2330 domain-containing protein [Chloroflexaceae bacterium]|nr:DUF2330 domain-containing protein [Chloroflexaceae bacterium]
MTFPQCFQDHSKRSVGGIAQASLSYRNGNEFPFCPLSRRTKTQKSIYLGNVPFTTQDWTLRLDLVILARDGDRTVSTMANDYQGEVQDFALVVPVVLKKAQVNVGNPAIIERLDSFSSPRLAEYFDPNPCARCRP